MQTADLLTRLGPWAWFIAAMLLFIAEHLIALALGREVAIDAFRDADHSA